MQIVYEKGMFAATADDNFEAVALVAAGFRFIKLRNAYVTSAPNVAAKFADYCTGEAAKRVSKLRTNKLSALEESYAVEADFEIPLSDWCLDHGYDFRPYQRAGVRFAWNRVNTLIADPPRVGKTNQAIGLMNMHAAPPRTLIICPAIVKVHWCREIERWSSHGLVPDYAVGDYCPKLNQTVVINYDILARHADYLQSQLWDLVVCDESHALKSGTSMRTTTILGGTRSKLPSIPFKRRVFMTGTPIYTRPIDLWTTVRAMDRNGLGSNWKTFIYRYCDAKSNGFGTDMSGASNLEELQARMRQSFMIRRDRASILNQIPPVRQTIIIPKSKVSDKLVKKERSVLQERLGWFEEALAAKDVDKVLTYAEQLDGINRMVCDECDGDGTVMDADDVMSCPNCHGAGTVPDPVKRMQGADTLAEVRQNLALSKLPAAMDFIETLLETESKVVVFCHHRAVVEELKNGLRSNGISAETIIGGMGQTRRQSIIDQFKDDAHLRVIIANITAAGVGISLAAADVAVFVETSWVPAEMEQAEDRVWESWKTVPVTIYKLLIEGSLDVEMDEIVMQRQRDISKAMDIGALLNASL